MTWTTEREKHYQMLKAQIAALDKERREALRPVREALEGCRGVLGIPNTATLDALVSVAPALVAALQPWLPPFDPQQYGRALRPAESREHVAQTWKTSTGPGVLHGE